MTIFIDLEHVVLNGSERAILEDLTLTVSSGDRIGVVGINGVGKTTLLRIVAGVLTPDSGQTRRSRDVRVSFLEQIPSLPDGTVRDALGSGWRVEAALDRLGMLAEIDTDIGSLSGGQLKRVALARAFIEPSDVLVLDEPTNHLDLDAIRWLEQEIRTYRGAVVMVSHDRFLLDQVTNRMVEIDRGKTYLHSGGYSKLLEAQADREAAAATAEQVRRNLARTELAWLRRGAKARSTKPQARVNAAHALLATRPQAAARSEALQFDSGVPRLGTSVIKAHHVKFSYDGGDEIVRDVTLELGPGERIGIVGANGSGKSTLVGLLAQRIEPSSGTVKSGPTVRLSYLDQGGGEFDDEATVQELVAGPEGIPGSLEDVALMKRFWFTGALPFTKAKDLSGGERRRLQLLLALSIRPNVLFLDEPTNDLDLETIRLVEEFLGQWPGTLVVVSHDRTFLSRTTDRLFEVREGTIAEVPGGIDAWIARTSEPLLQTAKGTATESAPVVDAPRGRQLREAEKEMTRLERRKSTLTDKLLATSDHTVQAALGAELSDVQTALAAAENHWLRLIE
ncbi:MAG TPA: ABC-F family ATP-binding cassette domain-containing protein [Acidimicrobiales bacterium]|nr:ABC-F family ATP-binding cassette domain-containing protein [Acidimicrobiales bacterium]